MYNCILRGFITRLYDCYVCDHGIFTHYLIHNDFVMSVDIGVRCERCDFQGKRYVTVFSTNGR